MTLKSTLQVMQGLTSGPGALALLEDVVESGKPLMLDIVAWIRTDGSTTGFTLAKLGKSDLRDGAFYVTSNGGAINYFFSNWASGCMLLRYNTAQARVDLLMLDVLSAVLLVFGSIFQHRIEPQSWKD